MKIAIFTEAGSAFGYGHLSRCTALKQGFEEHGCEVKMFIRGDADGRGEFDKVEWLDDFNKSFLDDVDIVVVDSYHAPKKLYDKIANWVKLGVWFDDTNRLSYPHGYKIDSKKLVLLRKPFWGSVKTDKKTTSKNSIFVSMGGVDNRELVTEIAVEIRKKFPLCRLVFASKVDKKLLGVDDLVLENADEQSVANAMKECSFAISAAGQTLLELSSLGVPSVAVVIAKNQIKNSKKCKRGNHVLAISSIEDKNWASKSVAKLRERQIVPIKSQSVEVAFDILKNAKICSLRKNLQFDDLHLKSFCNLSKAESMQVLSMRNAPDIRKWMTNKDEISLDEHKSFIKNRKKDINSFYWLVSNEAGAVGVVSLREVDFVGKQAEIGLYSAPNIRGYGEKFVELCKTIARQMGVRRLSATVHRDNKKAIELYNRTGFVKLSTKGIFDTMELKNEI